MGNFFKNKYLLGLLITTLTIILSMAFFDSTREKVPFVEDVVSVVVTPIQKLFSYIGYSITGTTSKFQSSKSLRQLNDELSSEVKKLNKELIELEELRNENERLRKLLSYNEQNPQREHISAEIIAKAPNNWYSTFTIDKGASHGIAKLQPVVSSNGDLVGVVSEVGTTWATVTTILDHDHSVGGIIARSRDVGVVEGDFTLQTNGFCKLTYISKNTNILVGDIIETSGQGGIYPKGIPVGSVVDISPETHSMSQFGTIKPAVDFSNLREVFIIKSAEVQP